MQNRTTEMNLRQTPQPFESCPSCQKDVVYQQKECFSCGIVFANYEKFHFEQGLKDQVGGIEHLTGDVVQSLDRSWKKIVVNYHDQEAHQRFIRLCFVEQAIPFAVYSYSRMLEIDKDDDIAVVMRRQALQMLAVQAEPAQTQAVAVPRRSIFFKWTVWLGLFASTLLVAMGFSVPQMHNLVGLGVSLLFLFLFTQFYFKSYFS